MSIIIALVQNKYIYRRELMQNNWSIEQTKKLFGYVKKANDNKKGLMWAFNKMSDESGKTVNSVRNYYYSQLKMFELVPSLASDLGIEIINTDRGQFKLFNKSEITKLVEDILIAKAEGVSVRAKINDLSKGDTKTALRLQNKYRSMVSNHKEKVNVIMKDMTSRGLVYYNPYLKQVQSKDMQLDNINNHERLVEYIESLDEKEVDTFFVLMKKLFA